MGDGKKESSVVWYRLRGLGLVCLCLAVFFVGAHLVNEQTMTVSTTVDGRELPVYCVQTDEKKIALTFDAAWGNEDTATILKILAARGVRATFFMTGGWVESYPEDVKAIAQAGHDLGNHSQNHKNMSELTKSAVKEEIMEVHEKVRELTGVDMKLFRCPYGDYDNDVLEVAKLCGYLTVQWDVDSLDWKNYGVDAVISQVTENPHLGNGSIILMHNGADYTASALETLITRLQELGYELVPVSELVHFDNFYMNQEGRQIQVSG